MQDCILEDVDFFPYGLVTQSAPDGTILEFNKNFSKVVPQPFFLLFDTFDTFISPETQALNGTINLKGKTGISTSGMPAPFTVVIFVQGRETVRVNFSPEAIFFNITKDFTLTNVSKNASIRIGIQTSTINGIIFDSGNLRL